MPRTKSPPGIGFGLAPLDDAPEVPRLRAESPARSRRDSRDDDDRPRHRVDRDDGGRRHRDDPARINSAALGLGITSLAIGVASLFPALVPCLGAVVAIPTAGIAFLLGAAGLTVALADGRRSIGLPIAGTTVSAIALGITVTWMAVISHAAAKIEEEAREAHARRVQEDARQAEAERRRRAEDDAREARRRAEEAAKRAEESRRAAELAAARERERAEAERQAEAKRQADREVARLSELKEVEDDLRAYLESAKGKVNKVRNDLVGAEREEAKHAEAGESGEAVTEKLMKAGKLSALDEQYVRGCVEGRLTHRPAADPAKIKLDVTRKLKDGDLGVPHYPLRFLDGVGLGSSSNAKVAQVISADEAVIYPGLVCVKGVSTAGLELGSRIDLKGVTVVADGKGTYTNGKGEEESVPRLIAVDFKKVSPVMSSAALKTWIAARTGLAEAKKRVAALAAAVRIAEQTHESEVSRRKAEIAKLKGG